jgi:hypothetical protein
MHVRINTISRYKKEKEKEKENLWQSSSLPSGLLASKEAEDEENCEHLCYFCLFVFVPNRVLRRRRRRR